MDSYAAGQTKAEGTCATIRKRLTVYGVVQGVGFRPFVYGLATRLGMVGFVGNDSNGVFIEVEGDVETVDQFKRNLQADAPTLAYIESVTEEAIRPQGDLDFIIVPSHAVEAANTLISPDLCICDDCLRELCDPNDRRYRYPFINCTNCGPRFTITKDIPYDRPLTTMAEFTLCPACQQEYDNPTDRRFHAQPNACGICGPKVRFVWGAKQGTKGVVALEGDEAIGKTQQALAHGTIVALKGLGGFHLACDATNDASVALLRERKGRIDKPFAIMVRDIETIKELAIVDGDELALLTSRQRPIVLLRKRRGGMLSHLVAPGNDYVGVMLPYTPLHHLFFDDTRSSPLIMTSANLSDEPIVKDNDEALQHLAGLADAFLMHDRDIHIHCDDSVVRVFEGRELPVRRSRGYAPFPVKLPFKARPILAVGGELKATFCLTKNKHAYMSQHIGDMQNLETLHAFEHAVGHFQEIFRVEPEIIACDQHPGYLSTQWAKDHADGRPVVTVQHHHAHLAALMAEHGLDGSEPVIGFSFDGTGHGSDGAIWGGEVLLADYGGFERLAHLNYVPLPGGDVAVKRPYRTAMAHLWAAGIDWYEGLPPVAACSEVERGILRRQLESGLNSVPTSSMGRLFDAVAALIGVRQTVTYEAQGAIELEALAAAEVLDRYTFQLVENGAMIQFDPASVICAIVDDLHADVPASSIAAKFHNGVADLIETLSQHLSAQTDVTTIALSGGLFQNVSLQRLTIERLRHHDLRVLIHHHVPPNDGGLALGQAVIANAVT